MKALTAFFAHECVSVPGGGASGWTSPVQWDHISCTCRSASQSSLSVHSTVGLASRGALGRGFLASVASEPSLEPGAGQAHGNGSFRWPCSQALALSLSQGVWCRPVPGTHPDCHSDLDTSPPRPLRALPRHQGCWSCLGCSLLLCLCSASCPEPTMECIPPLRAVRPSVLLYMSVCVCQCVCMTLYVCAGVCAHMCVGVHI